MIITDVLESFDGIDTTTVSWRLPVGASSLLSMTADVLGCFACRHQVLDRALAVGLDNLAIIHALQGSALRSQGMTGHRNQA
jgi:hypothetical protein